MDPFLKSAKPSYHLDSDEGFPTIRVEGCTSRDKDVAGNWPADDDGMNEKWSPQSD